jgi:hypothetical protein
MPGRRTCDRASCQVASRQNADLVAKWAAKARAEGLTVAQQCAGYFAERAALTDHEIERVSDAVAKPDEETT